MASKYPLRTRHKFEEVFGGQQVIDLHNITPTGVSTGSQLPGGAYSAAISVHGVALDRPVVLTIKPYADEAQTLVDGAYKFLEIGGTTATTNITIEANTATAKGYVRILVPAGDQYGAAAPIVSIFGSQYTLSTTATTGILTIATLAVEM